MKRRRPRGVRAPLVVRPVSDVACALDDEGRVWLFTPAGQTRIEAVDAVQLGRQLAALGLRGLTRTLAARIVADFRRRAGAAIDPPAATEPPETPPN